MNQRQVDHIRKTAPCIDHAERPLNEEGERLRYEYPWPGYAPRWISLWLWLHFDEDEALDLLRLQWEVWDGAPKVRAIALAYLKSGASEAAA